MQYHHTKHILITDIRKVFEHFQADLQMLALRTQAMELDHAQNCAEDVVSDGLSKRVFGVTYIYNCVMTLMGSLHKSTSVFS